MRRQGSSSVITAVSCVHTPVFHLGTMPVIDPPPPPARDSKNCSEQVWLTAWAPIPPSRCSFST